MINEDVVEEIKYRFYYPILTWYIWEWGSTWWRKRWEDM